MTFSNSMNGVVLLNGWRSGDAVGGHLNSEVSAAGRPVPVRNAVHFPAFLAANLSFSS